MDAGRDLLRCVAPAQRQRQAPNMPVAKLYSGALLRCARLQARGGVCVCACARAATHLPLRVRTLSISKPQPGRLRTKASLGYGAGIISPLPVCTSAGLAAMATTAARLGTRRWALADAVALALLRGDVTSLRRAGSYARRR